MSEINQNRFDELNFCDTENPIDLVELARCICACDHEEGHIEDYFYKLVEEVGELGAAMRKNLRDGIDGQTFKGSVEEEIGDVIYYAVCLANLYHIDLSAVIREKEKLNAEKYHRPICIK